MTDRRFATCPYCRAIDTVQSRHRNMRQSRRKFGFGWFLLTICTFGLAIPVYMMMHPVGKKVGVDRWNECSACGTTW